MDDRTGGNRPTGRLPLRLAVLSALLAGFSFQEEGASDNDVKAGHLLNFAKYVEWPADAFADGDTPITIGVLGRNTFRIRQPLEKLLRGKKAQDRSLTILAFPELKDLKPCHILFISAMEKENYPAIFEALKDKNILTVGETEGFATQGGIVNFYMDGKKVRFEINTDAAARAKLKIMSRLLKLARTIKDAPNGGSK